MKRNRRQIIEEAERIRLEEYCLNELDDMVDYRTGEILSTREYASMPMVWEEKDPIPPPFGEIASHTQMQRFMASKDRRNLKLFNGCRSIYDMDKGRAAFERSGIVFPTKMMLKLSQLVERLDYKNAIVTTPLDLSTFLEVSHANLHRHLHSLNRLIKVRGSKEGIAKGSIKVEVSPAYGFRYETASLDYIRGEEVEFWYQTVAQFLPINSIIDKGVEKHFAYRSSALRSCFL
ncbi:MAG: hypothetical protein ACQEUN_13880 [Pseudomonadota bacterium]